MIANGDFDDEGEAAAPLGSRAVGPGKGEQLVARRRQVPALGSRAVGPGKGEQLVARRRQVPALGSRAVGPGKGEQLVARRCQVPALDIVARLAQPRLG